MRTLLSWLGLCVILALSLAISACDRSDADESPEIAQLADVLDRLPPEVRARLSPFQRGIPGRWREVREDDPEFLADVERLSSLGYAAGVQPADGRGGAHTFDASHVQPGLGFWTSGHAPEAILSDLEGRLVHTWHATYDQVFPDSPLPKRNIATDYWRA
ncbi:MAG: hypothetical protein KC591_17945, partial [Gemmatimonadetes bacterium]|nr:hypothetical protein [Gemmatimonadota bacterium]